jgi:hypothetical protein
VRQTKAQVDYARACVHAVEDRRREFLGRRARHGFSCSPPGENGPDDERAVWTDGGRWRAAPRAQDSRYEGSVKARGRIALRASSGGAFRKLMKSPARKIRVPRLDRPINEADLYLRATARTFHERYEIK